MIQIKNAKELDGMRRANALSAAALKYGGEHIEAGMTTWELDKLIYDFIVKHGGIPNFKGLYGFPGTACISLNDTVIHGIPSHDIVIRPGDIVSIDTGAKVDAITIGVGSAGTVTGVGETIKAWTNDVRIVAVEPYENQVLGGGLTGPHGIPDIGYGIVPENYNSYVVDNVSAVASRDAQRAAQQVLRTDAIPASVSAGAALHAAAQLLANCNSRAALAIFSGRASIV